MGLELRRRALPVRAFVLVAGTLLLLSQASMVTPLGVYEVVIGLDSRWMDVTNFGLLAASNSRPDRTLSIDYTELETEARRSSTEPELSRWLLAMRDQIHSLRISSAMSVAMLILALVLRRTTDLGRLTLLLSACFVGGVGFIMVWIRLRHQAELMWPAPVQKNADFPIRTHGFTWNAMMFPLLAAAAASACGVFRLADPDAAGATSPVRMPRPWLYGSLSAATVALLVSWFVGS